MITLTEQKRAVKKSLQIFNIETACYFIFLIELLTLLLYHCVPKTYTL